MPRSKAASHTVRKKHTIRLDLSLVGFGFSAIIVTNFWAVWQTHLHSDLFRELPVMWWHFWRDPSRELAQGAHAPQLLSLALGHIHFAPLVPQHEERGGKSQGIDSPPLPVPQSCEVQGVLSWVGRAGHSCHSHLPAWLRFPPSHTPNPLWSSPEYSVNKSKVSSVWLIALHA